MILATPPIPPVVRRSSDRLKDQGWVNRHRKPLFLLLAPAFAAYLIFVRNPLHPAGGTLLTAQIAGIFLIFAGLLGRVFSTLTIGGLKDKTVASTELYSICRNPLYFSSFLMALGIGLLTGRLDFTLLIAAAYLAVFYPMMLGESRYLRALLPDFAAYEKKVPLFFPDPRLWHARRSFEIRFNLTARTCLDASLVLLLIPAIVIGRLFL